MLALVVAGVLFLYASAELSGVSVCMILWYGMYVLCRCNQCQSVRVLCCLRSTFWWTRGVCICVDVSV